MTMTTPAITCEKCNHGTMEATRVTRGTGTMALFGRLFWIPSAVVIALNLYVLADTGGNMFANLFITLALPALILGLVMARKKNVWKCPACGYIFDRA